MRLIHLAKLEQLVKESNLPADDQTPLLNMIEEVREAHTMGLLPPDWSEIDRRFIYRGMDDKGSWYALTDEPLENSHGYQRLKGEMMFISVPFTHRWRETLKRRP